MGGDDRSELDRCPQHATGASLNGTNGQLVRIDSAYENELIRAFAIDSGNDLWIGASDQTIEGDWHWYDSSQDGDRFWVGNSTGTAEAGNYVNWHLTNNQPNDAGGGQDSAAIATSGTWFDDPYSNLRGYVIEWDASEVLSGFTFSLTDNAGGRFAIDHSTGEITVADGSLLNFEAFDRHSITVRTTDAGGLFFERTLTVNLTDVNEAPVDLVDERTFDQGVEINAGTANNQYLVAGGMETLFNGLTDFTIQGTIATDTSTLNQAWFSYANDAEDNTI